MILAQHTLVAPYDALVITRSKELGTVASSGDPVFTLIDPETVWALAYIDESRSGSLRVGQAAEVVLRSAPGERLSGRIIRIGIEADRVNEERRVYVGFENCPDDFHLGEQAEVFINAGRVENATFVASSAVENLNGRSGSVWTVEGGKLNRREVTFGQKLLDGRLEIVGGLPADARVVSRLGSRWRVGRAATIEGPRS